MPSRPTGRLYRENDGFSEILTRTWGTLTFTCNGRCRVFGRPVIAMRGLSGARDLVGFTVEWWNSQTTCAALPGKLWFLRNRGTNMTKNAHFRIEKASRGYPLRLGTFSTFGSCRLSGVCSPYNCLHGA